MARFFFASLRARLLLLVLLAVIPALVLALYTNLEERQLRKALVQEDAMRLSRLVSADYERLIEDARQLVVSLARLPAVRGRNRAACNAVFTDLLTQHSSYVNLGVVDADGNVLCSALPITDPVYLGDRVYFRRALETRDFAVGEYQVGRITRRATVNFGYPVLDDAGDVRAVVFAALDLAWLSALARQAGLLPGSMLTVIDRHGTILARYPDEGKWVGKLMPEPSVLNAILTQQGNGMIDAAGTDGIPRLLLFAPFGSAAQSANAYVSVGIPAAVAFAGVKPDSRPQSCDLGARRRPRARRRLGGRKSVHRAPDPRPRRSDEANCNRRAERAHRAYSGARRAKPARRRLRPDGRVVGTGARTEAPGGGTAPEKLPARAAEPGHSGGEPVEDRVCLDGLTRAADSADVDPRIRRAAARGRADGRRGTREFDDRKEKRGPIVGNDQRSP